MSKLSNASKQEMLGLMRRFKREKFQPYVDHQGITPSEMNVILGIHMAQEHGIDPVQPRDLAAWLHLTPSALSQTLKMLEEKDFLRRQRTSSDSRAVSLALTEKGSGVASKASRARDKFMDDLVEYIGEEDVRHLIDTFNRVFDFLSRQADEGAIQRGNYGMHPPCEPTFEREDRL